MSVQPEKCLNIYNMYAIWIVSSLHPRTQFMHLDPKISGAKLAFLSVWRRGYSLNCTLWRTGAIKWKTRWTLFWSLRLLCTPTFKITASIVKIVLLSWTLRTPEEPLACLQREFYTGCTLAYIIISNCSSPNLKHLISIATLSIENDKCLLYAQHSSYKNWFVDLRKP